MSSKEDSSLTDWDIVSIKLLAQNTIIPFLQSYKVRDEYCSICRSNFNENSLNNKSILKKDSLGIGKCGHCFHKCCIDNWLNEQSTCPICAKNWDYLIIDDMSGIKEKLIPHSVFDLQNQPECKLEDLEDLEEKIEEFGVSWGDSEQEQSSQQQSITNDNLQLGSELDALDALYESETASTEEIPSLEPDIDEDMTELDSSDEDMPELESELTDEDMPELVD
jgi:hypothetical protein